MNITISGKNVEVTDSLKTLITKKLSKVEKFLRPDTDVHVQFSVDGYRQICEITIPYAGVIIRGEEATGDMYASIDGVIAKIEKQIERHRTKLERRWHGAQGGLDMAGFPDEEEDEDGPRIVRTKRFAVKPLLLDEAALQLQLLGHDFFVFLNAETEQVNVLYKRKDGNFGLIEPIFDDEE